VLIAATDPVSVIATFKDAKVQGRIRLLVEAESLFNDGTAAVAFTLAIAFVSGQTIGAVGAAKTFILVVLGSIVCGAVVAGLVLLLSGAANDHLVEVTFSTVAAFGSFLIAEHFHLSGILATLAAGLIIGNVGHLAITSTGRKAVVEFWEYAAFVANSLIFLLIGIRVAHQDYRSVVFPAMAAIVIVLIGRALAVYLLSLFFVRSKRRISPGHQHVLFWGGLRGALALALALGLPQHMAYRQEIINVAFAVVAFSIIVQGLTIIPLLRRTVSANAD
jgi:CPA1 family monovalent cation:H+ antiporter